MYVFSYTSLLDIMRDFSSVSIVRVAFGYVLMVCITYLYYYPYGVGPSSNLFFCFFCHTCNQNVTAVSKKQMKSCQNAVLKAGIVLFVSFSPFPHPSPSLFLSLSVSRSLYHTHTHTHTHTYMLVVFLSWFNSYE